MAVPKRKTSKARKNKRRSSVWKLDTPNFTKCPNCGHFMKTHRVCVECGMYKGVQVIEVNAE
jgi:large subunit ribosomal protein L32